jgi:hypothetical protein
LRRAIESLGEARYQTGWLAAKPDRSSFTGRARRHLIAAALHWEARKTVERLIAGAT